MLKSTKVIFGSARLDENGRVDGGKAGDQKQQNNPDFNGEVSMQDWYLHSKGWYVIRAKDDIHREKIAYAMEAACENPNIGYSQGTRYTAQDYCKYSLNGDYDPAHINAPVNVDCSALVRLCCMYAGINTGDIYTSIMPKTMAAMKEFDLIDDTKITNVSTNLMRGDILVTRTTGHTVVAITDGKNNYIPGEYVYARKCYDDEFDPVFYANKYADLKNAFGNDAYKLLQHWVQYGKKEGRIAKAQEVITKKYVVPQTDTNIRLEASMNSKIITVAKTGTKHEVITETNDGTRTWAKIQQGWLSERYCQVFTESVKECLFNNNTIPDDGKTKKTAVILTDLYVRKTPSLTGAIVRVAKQNSQYTILDSKSDGTRTWLNIGDGWVSGNYCKVQ